MLLVIGLDCAAPSLVFDRLRAHLPNVSALMTRGMWGSLRSTIPPITMPAWACMVSGRDPGELGIYGFRNRIDGTRALRVATADDVHAPRVWDVLGAAGKRSAVLYVPPTWPPRAIENGELVSCMLTPGPDSAHAHPPALAQELEASFGPHTPDVVRAGADGDALIDALHDAATHHFDVAEHMLESRRPDFLMMVEMGTDRLHHAAWPALDPSDPRHDARSPMVRDARDFYAYLDARIGRLALRAGTDATVMIVSDHGARPLRGGVYVNEWLRREGWLALRSEPDAPCPIERADVDWSRTQAWAEGGYFARITMNVRGRFPDGAIEERDLGAEIDRLERALLAMRDDEGRALENRVVRPRVAYREVRGTPPDLLLFVSDLDRRALGEIGGGRVLVGPEEAGASGGRGADGCNHDWEGLFVLAGPEVPRAGRVEGASIHDVGVSALRLMGVEVPEGWLGRDLRELAPSSRAPAASPTRKDRS
ncbi:MAG: alkaline phosphatase family protein [Myxococcota bacterium]|nr:alkaline phosphatase family protein [Myxococcota bacterium]